MKKLHYLFMMLAVAIGSLVLFSCSSDKDEPEQGPYIFDPDNAHYIGEMRTEFIMGLEVVPYSNPDSHWSIIIDRQNAKATVYIHDAKFANAMPSQGLMMIDGLTYNAQAETITGTDIVPKVQEGNGFTPYESFPFKSIQVQYASKAHTTVSVTFSVEMNMPSNPGMPTMPGMDNKMLGSGSFRGTGVPNCEKCF